jgi:hypothetical protein
MLCLINNAPQKFFCPTFGVHFNFGKVGFITFTLHPTKVITRARSGVGYVNKSDLSYKPQKFNDKCQRASTPNKTMFYGTIIEEERSLIDTRLIAASECSALLRGGLESSGIEKITYGRWQVVKNVNLLTVVHKDIFSDVANKLLKELQGAYKGFAEEFPDTEEKNDLIMKFLAEEFSKKDIANDYDYFLSAIFSEFVTSDLGYDGIMYPSVQAGGDLGFNVAITPEAVDENLKLDIVGESTLYKNQGKSIVIVDKISSMESWTYLDSISNSQRDNAIILNELGISSFDELKQTETRS